MSGKAQKIISAKEIEKYREIFYPDYGFNGFLKKKLF